MSIEYSDGHEIERKILDLTKAQVTLGSEHAIAAEHYDSWPVKYHLCPERANLLRHFDFSGLDVLELGAGMGAVSRFLAEKAKSLYVVEGTEERYAVLSERLRDLQNWGGEVGNISEIAIEKKFDVVCVIGVLEYSELYVTPPEGSTKSPFECFLDRARSFLKPGGVLLLAIENRLGLKYWSGAAEDHLASLFDGVCGYPLKPTPKTFSRVGLHRLLETSGFVNRREYFPFPDYKIPSAVLSSELVEADPFLSTEIAAAQPFVNYGFPTVKYFPDRLALRGVAEAGLLADFSNSFLFAASVDPDSSVLAHLLGGAKGAVGWYYANYRKHPVVTRFTLEGQRVLVDKQSLANPERKTISLVSALGEVKWKAQELENAATGQSIRSLLANSAYFRDWDSYLGLLRAFLAWSFRRWADSSVPPGSLAGDSLDAIFVNACLPAGAAFRPGVKPEDFELFDLEWNLADGVPKSWFIFRNVFNLSRDEVLLSSLAPFHSLTALYEQLCREMGVTPDLEGDLNREASLQQATSNLNSRERHLRLLRGLFERSFGPSSLPRDAAIESNARTELSRLQVENENLHRRLQSLPHKLASKTARIGEKVPFVGKAFTALFAWVYSFAKKVRARGRRWGSLRAEALQVSPGVRPGHSELRSRIGYPEMFMEVEVTDESGLLESAQLEFKVRVDGGKSVPAEVALVKKGQTFRRFFKLGIEADSLELRVVPATAPSNFSVRVRRYPLPAAALRLLIPHLSRVAVSDPKRLVSFFSDGYRFIRARGRTGLYQWLKQEAFQQEFPVLNPYSLWVERFDRLSEDDLQAIRADVATLKYRPLISIVVPVYDTDEKWLRAAIESVRAQLYPNWELCIADDRSPSAHVKPILEEYRVRDSRIKVAYRETNGHISAASNTALALASGEFVALLDHDDVLAPHALYAMVKELEANPSLDMLYSDEDKIDAHGRRFEPHFKSQWNPDLFYSLNLVTHLAVFRSSILREIGGFRTGYEGSQDYDITARFVEQTTPERIRHVPHVLYHWRVIPGSVALDAGEKSYAHDAARRALQSHFDRTRVPAKVVKGYAQLHRVQYPLPNPIPLVTAIICTRDRKDLLEVCVTGLLEETDYPHLNVIIVDNQSREPETLEYFRTLLNNPRVRVLRYDKPFNYAAMNNLAAREAHSPILAFLNNDLKVISRDWLAEMVSFAIRPEFGAVGAKLLYPDGRVQHAGIHLGIGGVADHTHRFVPREDPGYIGRPQVIQGFSAVTAACLVVRKKAFEAVGGFEEVHLAVAYNDVDLCLKLRESGLRNVMTPYAELYHFESASRGSDGNAANAQRFQAEADYMKRRWGAWLKQDPYYNPNLSDRTTDFALAFPPRVEKPWRKKSGLQKNKAVTKSLEIKTSSTPQLSV